ncbi:hypothetical protein BDN72DRAFT_848070, partial [Pluteus cervinus]
QDSKILKDYLSYRTDSLRRERRRTRKKIMATRDQSGNLTTRGFDSAKPPQDINEDTMLPRGYQRTRDSLFSDPEPESADPTPPLPSSFPPPQNNPTGSPISSREHSVQRSSVLSPETTTNPRDDAELLHFLTQICDPPLHHLHGVLTRVGCRMQHMQAMSTWSRNLLDDVLERLKLKITELDDTGAGVGGLPREYDDEEALTRRRRIEESALRTSGRGIDTRASIMDWEVLRYHILRIPTRSVY